LPPLRFGDSLSPFFQELQEAGYTIFRTARRSLNDSAGGLVQTAPSPGASTCTLDCDAKTLESAAALVSLTQDTPKGSWLHGFGEPTLMKLPAAARRAAWEWPEVVGWSKDTQMVFVEC